MSTQMMGHSPPHETDNAGTRNNMLPMEKVIYGKILSSPTTQQDAATLRRHFDLQM